MDNRSQDHCSCTTLARLLLLTHDSIAPLQGTSLTLAWPGLKCPLGCWKGGALDTGLWYMD